MIGDANQSVPVDRRVIIYRIVMRLSILLVVVLAVKFLLLDTVEIRTNQMFPTLREGDRAVLLRLRSHFPLNPIWGMHIGTIVVLGDAGSAERWNCLRVAGLPGDTVWALDGIFDNTSRRLPRRVHWSTATDTLPAEYSPRDNMPAYCVPRRGDVFSLDSLGFRDFFFTTGIIRQQNPGKRYIVRPALYVDGQLRAGYSVNDFTLYKGNLDSVPEPLRSDWFFWERLRDHLVRAMANREAWLSFSLWEGGAMVARYRMKESCIFVLADSWAAGFDSRYFGPVSASAVKGTVHLVLWSVRPRSEKGFRLRLSRIFRIIL